MTPSDRREFVAAFDRLSVTLKNSYSKKSDKEVAAIQIVYFDSLQHCSIQAILGAERLFRSDGTSDGWFPSAPEWAAVALDYEIGQAEAEAQQRLLLPPSPEAVAAELNETEQARAACVAMCRQNGFAGIADYLAGLPLRHPSEARDLPHCLRCGDQGQIVDDDTNTVGPCPCVDTNPAIRHQRLVRRRRALTEGRKTRNLELSGR